MPPPRGNLRAGHRRGRRTCVAADREGKADTLGSGQLSTKPRPARATPDQIVVRPTLLSSVAKRKGEYPNAPHSCSKRPHRRVAVWRNCYTLELRHVPSLALVPLSYGFGSACEGKEEGAQMCPLLR